MRSTRTALFGALLALSATACSSVRYNNDFDPSINFADFSTYAWLEAEGQAEANRGVDEFTERRIVAAVDNELAAKGYKKATSGQPDILINFYVTTEKKMDVDTYYTGWGYYGWYGGTQTTVRQWTEGTLVIDFIDTAEKDLAWRGWAQGELQHSLSPEERTRRINTVVAGILKQYPPNS
ncbi:MAG: DUF4136 domain-containing protein [Gemmatimonadales bacterium]|jgi:hypothetical protein